MDNKTIIKKLNNIFKLGYIPSRGNQVYKPYVSECFNCVEHTIFNLKNEHVTDYKITPFQSRIFWNLNCEGSADPQKIEKRILEVVTSTGLCIQKTNEYKEIESNQWKIAYYFSPQWNDYHFMLQENDGSWSSKAGVCSKLEYYSDLPYIYNKHYELQSVYVVTNPYKKIDETNTKSKISKNQNQSIEKE